MSKPKIDDELKKKAGSRLKEAIIDKYGKIDYVHFIYDLDNAAYEKSPDLDPDKHVTTKQTLSRTIHGEASLTERMAEKYAPILGVNIAWLMGIDEYRTENDKRAAELNSMLKEYQDHIHDVEGYDGSMRKDIRTFFNLMALSKHEISIELASADEFLSACGTPSDFMKACQLEIGSMYDVEYYENFNLYNSFITDVDIDGVKYSLITDQFHDLVYATLEATKDTINNIFKIASISTHSTGNI